MPYSLRAIALAAMLVVLPAAPGRVVYHAMTRPVTLTSPASLRAHATASPSQTIPAALLRAMRGESGALAPGLTGRALQVRLAALGRLVERYATRSGTGPAIAAWAPAIAMLAGGGPSHAIVARALVQDVYERLGVRPDWAAVDRVAPLPRGAPSFHVDYPLAIAVPSPNLWPTPRKRKRTISYVVIHDTESGCASALNTLINPISEASAHFLVCRDGRIYQLVRVADSAWHAGNVYINLHSIGIEHEGYAGRAFTPEQYAATSSLLRWIAKHTPVAQWKVQWTRNAVIGHENVPAADHTDPGPGWNWPYFMSLLRSGRPYTGGNNNIATVIWPNVYVHACALIACRVLGTANWGEQFHVRGRSPGWVAVDYAGYHGWILSAATASGWGVLVHTRTNRPVTILSAPGPAGDPVGRLIAGQSYVSTLVDDAADRRGWWFIEYAHRYGFVCTCTTLPVYHPTPSPVPPPLRTVTPTATMTITPPLTLTVPATPTSTRTPHPTGTPTASPTPTAPLTPAPSLTPTPTVSFTPTAAPSPAVALTTTVSTGPTVTPLPLPPTPTVDGG